MKAGSVEVRPERPADQAVVWRVNNWAFGQPGEADLVDRLRDEADPYLAFVAEVGGEIVGHIAFTPVSVEGQHDLDIRGLAPMAVLPEHQRTGVGSALVRVGLAACRADGARAVVVLGHSAYYPRFGFVPAADFGLSSEYDVPREVFMALELEPGALNGMSGRARYHAAFAG